MPQHPQAMNRWIVTKHRYREHKTLEAAQEEMKRLQEKTGTDFHLYRIKNDIAPDEGEKQGEAG